MYSTSCPSTKPSPCSPKSIERLHLRNSTQSDHTESTLEKNNHAIYPPSSCLRHSCLLLLHPQGHQLNITINVNLDNASFKENQAELNEIVAQQIPHNLRPSDTGRLKDSNGNTVGSYRVEE